MKILSVILFLIFISPPAFAINSAPESIIRAMIAGEQVPGKECKDAPEERCISFDGIDVSTSDLIDGQLIPNPDKKFAKELSDKNAKEAATAKDLKCKNLSFKGTTIAQLRQELNDSMECRK